MAEVAKYITVKRPLKSISDLYRNAGAKISLMAVVHGSRSCKEV
jgi:hypothetical protein